MNDRKWSMVEVKLFYRPEGETWYARIELESNVRPGIKSWKELDFDLASTMDSFVQACQATGGVLADYQNKLYGDAHNAMDTAQAAGELFKEIYAEALSEDTTKPKKILGPRGHQYSDGIESDGE